MRLNDSILEKSVLAGNSFQSFTIRWLKKYLRTSVEQRGKNFVGVAYKNCILLLLLLIGVNENQRVYAVREWNLAHTEGSQTWLRCRINFYHLTNSANSAIFELYVAVYLRNRGRQLLSLASQLCALATCRLDSNNVFSDHFGARRNL